ncbi:hypothetical protein HOY34_20675 [Xinfangfangia sp. D13-10-4-6]|uniref:hypothetical protein n=1 Tax=Pseudogemmobacter hezensis TaxID=2737662 RepID=UPI001551DBB5|nr:hypothetical protein [Pseudogemmobacter hezensis]NPD17604.1 hypothetical protein [Pseudogemmobacter hezensis]
MGELLDRAYQREILQALASVYPQSPNLRKLFGEMDDKFQVNAVYLSEHELIRANLRQAINAPRSVIQAEITARGLDFLQDDGGLSAILGTITVKLHDDTIRALLIDKVQKSDAAPSVKSRLVETIKGLPAEALKRLAQKAMDAGIEQIPEAAEQLQGWLGL